MEHEKMKDLLFLYYDGELSPPQAEDVKTHLKACVECRMELEEWEKMTNLIFRPCLEKPWDTESFVQKVMKRLPEPEKLSLFENLSLWWKIPTLALTAFIIVFLGPQPSESLLSTETLLLNGNAEERLEWLFEQENTQPDSMIGFFWEGV